MRHSAMIQVPQDGSLQDITSLQLSPWLIILLIAPDALIGAQAYAKSKVLIST